MKFHGSRAIFFALCLLLGIVSSVIWFRCELIHSAQSFFAALTCIVGIVGFYFLFRQLKATENSAKAAEDMVQSHIDGQRGRFMLRKIEASENRMHEPLFWFINIGRTALMHVDSTFLLEVIDAKPGANPTHFKGSSNNANTRVVKPDEEMSNAEQVNGVQLSRISHAISKEEREAIVKGEKFLWLRGWLRYDDVFGDRYQLNFAAMWHPDHDNFTTSEWPLYNQEQHLFGPT